MGTGMGTAADEKIDSSVISIAYRLSMAEGATWSTANSKTPRLFHSERWPVLAAADAPQI